MITKGIKNVIQTIFFPRPRKPPFHHICQVGDPVLRSVAESVPLDSISSPEIKKTISLMIRVMRKYKSNGISAPQIGVSLRILAMELPASDLKTKQAAMIDAKRITPIPLTVVINPEMKVTDYTKVTFPEGCESVRGFCADVVRYEAIQLSGLDPFGERTSHDLSGWSARIAQHEMEHLDGRLYIDSMDSATFQNVGWHKINVREGRVKIKYN